jgi:hypothetical protein
LREPENTMSKRLVFMLSLPFAVVVGSRVVRSDLDNAPGSMCVAAAGALTVNTAGQVENKGTVNATAICPTERKMINGALATNFSATVWVLDQHSVGNICCTVVSHQPNGVIKESATLACSSGSSASYQALSVPGITEPATFADWFVRCTVPLPESGKTSRILTYRSTQS